MSLATLKRKTQTKYNNMSVNKGTFSLNGTTRNQGYVGQTSLSRTLIRTLKNGTATRGHGGCCNNGTEIKQTEFLCLEDNSVLKGSTLNTKGMLSERCCNNSFNVVKPDSNNNINSNYYVVEKNKKEALNCVISTVDLSNNAFNCNNACKPKKSDVTKPDEAYLIMSSSNYLEKINKACTNNDSFYVPYSVKKAPFAGFSKN
tara:strand:+ start:383 stop:988 length:606 start_codon:yes stop_codon:yes gene_type:complete